MAGKKKAAGKRSEPKAEKPAKAEKRLAVATAAVDELKAQVSTLRERVRTLEAEAESWRTKARRNKSRLQKLRDQADHAIADATASARKRGGKVKDVITDHVVPEQREEPAVVLSVVEDPPGGPDASWTVARLRAEARGRGVAGYSRLTKAELLAALSR